MSLEKFLTLERLAMLAALKKITLEHEHELKIQKFSDRQTSETDSEVDETLRFRSEEDGEDQNSSDRQTSEDEFLIRLAVDLVIGGTCPNERGVGYAWRFWTGPVDYDPWHSDYYAASSITTSPNEREILDNLFDQLLELEAMETSACRS